MPTYEVRVPVAGYVVEIVEADDEDEAIDDVLTHGVRIHNLEMLYTCGKCTTCTFGKIEDYDTEAIEMDENEDEIYEEAYDIVKQFDEAESNIGTANIARAALELCRKIVDGQHG